MSRFQLPRSNNTLVGGPKQYNISLSIKINIKIWDFFKFIEGEKRRRKTLWKGCLYYMRMKPKDKKKKSATSLPLCLCLYHIIILRWFYLCYMRYCFCFFGFQWSGRTKRMNVYDCWGHPPVMWIFQIWRQAHKHRYRDWIFWVSSWGSSISTKFVLLISQIWMHETRVSIVSWAIFALELSKAFRCRHQLGTLNSRDFANCLIQYPYRTTNKIFLKRGNIW